MRRLLSPLQFKTFYTKRTFGNLAITHTAVSTQSKSMTTQNTPTVEDLSSCEAANTDTANAETTHEQSSETNHKPLPLPAPPAKSDVKELDVSSGQGVKLDHLGPMIVNRDGTLSRISNWENLSEIERRNTLRILGKRNQLRLDGLKKENGEAETQS